MTSNGSTTSVYDDEDRLIATSANSYVYDGDGERVEKCTEGTTPGTCASGATGTLYWRGLGSDPLTETNLSGTVQNTYIFFGGQRVARSDNAGAIHYYFSDHLGSHGVVENATGSACEQDVDYYPYGGQENDYCTTPVAQNYKFTGKERDAESGLDNFGARYDASSLGRFMTPDWAAKPINVPYANFGNPQSLNLYSYVQNNPTTFGDPDGHCCWDAIVNWLTSSHSASGSAGVDAGHSVDKAGGLSITSRAFAADASGSASYGKGGVKVSGEAGVVVASEKATEGSIGTTSTKAVSADAEAHAGASLTGLSAGAGANADVVSATQTIKLGPVTLSATGNVGIGAEASASVSTTGVSASAGVTPGFGGAVSVSVSFGQGSVSGGASVQSTSTGTGVKTTIDKPKIKSE